MTTNKKGVEDFTFYDAESIATLHRMGKRENRFRRERAIVITSRVFGISVISSYT